MNTEIAFIYESDLSSENKLLKIPTYSCVLEGIGIVEMTRSLIVEERNFNNLVNHIFRLYPDGSFWLLTGHSAWQPNNRITKYRKLWGSLEARGVKLDDLANSRNSQWAIESEGKVKYFGLFELQEPRFDFLKELTSLERITRMIFIVSPANLESIKNLCVNGWDGFSATPPNELIKMLCNIKSLLFQTIGEFDDKNSGFVAIGKHGVLRKSHSI